MARYKFRWNHRALEKLARNPQVANQLEKAADEIAKNVRRNAVDSGIVDGRGRYDGLEVERTGDSVRVGSSYFATLIEEYGSANNPPRGTFRRSVEDAGLRFDDKG